MPPDFPLQQRPEWPLGAKRQDTLLLRIQRVGDGAVAHVGVRRHRLRALPGAWYLQVPKLGVGIPVWAVQATLVALRHLAAHWWRVARVRVELCLLHTSDELADLEDAGEALGFRVAPPLEYAHTLLLALPDTPEQAAAQFHRSVFKNARKLDRAGHVLRSIDDTRYASRLSELYAETMSRSGAHFIAPDMAAVLRCTAAQPQRYRIVGLFRNGVVDPENLLAFRWCGCAGRYAYDLLAASTRLSDENGQIPMMPSIVLDLLTWARKQGAREFDFGGVVLQGDPRSAQVAGVSRFKMQFGERVIRVGSDLMLEPRTSWRLLEEMVQGLRRVAQK